MDTTTILILTALAAAFVALAFIGGYETAQRQLAGKLQAQADRRVQGILADLPKRKRITKKINRRASK